MKKILILFVVFSLVCFPVLVQAAPVSVTVFSGQPVSTISGSSKAFNGLNVTSISFTASNQDLKFYIFNKSGVQVYNGSLNKGQTQTYTVNLKDVGSARVGTYYDDMGTGYATLILYGNNENNEKEKFVINNLKTVPTSTTSVSLSWSAIDSVFFKHYKVYQDGTALLGTVTTNLLSVSQLVPGQTYSFKVIPVDTDNVEYDGSSISYTVPVPDTTPPAVPVNVKVTPDRYRATVTANPVLDSDLAGYHVYLNGNRATSQPVQLPYDLTGLKLDTDYEVEVASIDISGNLSARSTKVAFKTLNLETAPAAVTTLTGTPFNGGASLSWSAVAAAKEYKIYKGDGSFIMKTTQTSAKIQRLKNGQVVTFYVIASNDIGDSPKSNVVEVKPDSALAPDVSLGYSLKEVADGTSSWFNSYWLILAFSLSIPLSFYVSNRIKGLFVS